MAPIDGNRPRLTRSPSAPIRPATRPQVQRSNSAPARTPSPVRDAMDPRRVTPSTPSSTASRGAVFTKLKDAAKYVQRNGENQVSQAVAAAGTSALGVAKAAAGTAGSVFGIYSGVKNIIEGAKNGNGHQVAGGVLGTGKGVLGTAKGVLTTAAAWESRAAFKGLEKAALAAIGDGSKLSKGIASAAAEAVHLGKDLSKVDVLGQAARSSGFLGKVGTTLKSAAGGLLGKLPFGLGAGAAAKLESSIIKSGAKALGGTAKGVATALETAGAATKAAGAAAKGAGTAAKLAGRFAPGLNVGIAALDVGIAIKTITDPNASVAAKVTSGITALGSVVAATNIPVVSQIGAAVSIASTAVGAAIENFDAIKEGVGKAASAVADGAKKVGSAIADGAKKIFSGW